MHKQKCTNTSIDPVNLLFKSPYDMYIRELIGPEVRAMGQDHRKRIKDFFDNGKDFFDNKLVNGLWQSWSKEEPLNRRPEPYILGKVTKDESGRNQIWT